jgi:hypothetical protein
MSSPIQGIGILTTGGECPGLHAIIRAADRSAERLGYACIGFLRGSKGLADPVSSLPLHARTIAGILTREGTILGLSTRAISAKWSATGPRTSRACRSPKRSASCRGSSRPAPRSRRWASAIARNSPPASPSGPRQPPSAALARTGHGPPSREPLPFGRGEGVGKW